MPRRFHRAARRSGAAPRGAQRGGAIDLADVTYYVCHETVVPADDEIALPRWVEALVAFMQRNSVHLTDYFKPPIGAVVEIGREISI